MGSKMKLAAVSSKSKGVKIIKPSDVFAYGIERAKLV